MRGTLQPGRAGIPSILTADSLIIVYLHLEHSELMIYFMKKNALLTALVAAALLCGCKAQDSAPSALDVIMTRTSIRSFTGEAVSKAQLETILKAGMAAPTAMNGQPWRFVVVTDKDKMASVFGAGPRSEMFTTAGAVIVVCGQTTSMGRPFGAQPDAPVPRRTSSWRSRPSAWAPSGPPDTRLRNGSPPSPPRWGCLPTSSRSASFRSASRPKTRLRRTNGSPSTSTGSSGRRLATDEEREAFAGLPF